jgi:hypothetical protein
MIAKAYFIFDANYARYDAAIDGVDAGYPKTIGSNWPGFATAGFDTKIDTALDWGNGKVYFFKGADYLRYDIPANRVDAGYPLPIRDHWIGMDDVGFADGLNASVNWGNGKVYFFKNESYVRYDVEQDRVDDGFPRTINEGWPGFGAVGFGSSLDSALNWGNGKVYFFKGDSYLRYDIAGDAIDPGFPLDIDGHWPGLGVARAGRPIAAAWSRVTGATASTDFSYLSDDFFTELKAISARLRCAPEDLLGVMESESSVMPSAQNPRGKATGLIQFMPATLTGLGWTQGPDAFRSLTADDQLPFVERFYRPHIGQLTSPGRLYQATFLPATLMGTDETSVIAAPGGPNANAYRDNTLLDTNRDGAITVSDLTARIDAVRQGPRWAALTARLAQ